MERRRVCRGSITAGGSSARARHAQTVCGNASGCITAWHHRPAGSHSDSLHSVDQSGEGTSWEEMMSYEV